MRPTYENIYISSFIFSLGYLFRKNNKGDLSSVSIDLYQQITAGEKLIGDLLTSIGGRNIIIEFKREYSQIPAEFKKKSKETLIELLESDNEKEFQAISKKCHFLSFASAYENGDSTLAFSPYIELLKNPNNAKKLGNSLFTSLYVNSEDDSIGVNDADFKYYVDRLTVSSGGTCGGMAISIDDEGIRSMVIFDDIKELSQSLIVAENRAEKLIESKEHNNDVHHYSVPNNN